MDTSAATAQKSTIKTLVPLFIIILVTLFFVYNKVSQPPVPPAHRQSFTTMGTVASVTFYGKPEATKKAAAAVIAGFKQIETTCNIFNPASELSQLNKTAHDKPFKCSKLLWDLLLESKSFYEISGGAFDVTAKPLMNVWGFYRKRKQLPSQKELDEALKTVGMNNVVFDMKAQTVKFTVSDMSFDLGGIAKGYAVDLAAKAVQDLGIDRGTINLGGNIRCLPLPPPGKQDYSIGIKNPVDKTDLCGVINVRNTSIATSGNYERYIILDNQRYTHIMDVTTGQPVKNMLGVTVVTPLATYADALSTSIFIKGEKLAREVCKRIPGTHVLIIKNSKEDVNKLEVIRIGSIWHELSLTE